MKYFDIHVIGNSIWDQVYYVNSLEENSANKAFSSYEALGGIGNFVRAVDHLDSENQAKICFSTAIGSDIYSNNVRKYLESIHESNKNLKFNITQTPARLSKATIIHDEQKNQKTSIVDWQTCQLPDICNISSSWTHIMYLDAMCDIRENHLKKLSDNSIVSADLCLAHHSREDVEHLQKLLPYVDYLIISDSESSLLNRTVAQSKVATIIHSAEGSEWFLRQENTRNKFSSDVKISNVNVLGAGDIFAAAFIFSMIRGGTMERSIRYAHKHTSLRLIERLYDEEV